MIYKIKLEKKASKFISKQPKQNRIRIFEAIYNLPKGDIKTLKGQDNLYRLRVGNYRVIYSINENDREQVTIFIIENIGNRGQVYNNL